MKKILFLFWGLILILSCDFGVVKKPSKLINRSQMVDIIYDLSVLEALKSQNISANTYPTPTQFLKSKYKIDSITFAKNTKYYASDVKEYKKLYAEVQSRLEGEISKRNGGKNTSAGTPKPIVN